MAVQEPVWYIQSEDVLNQDEFIRISLKNLAFYGSFKSALLGFNIHH